MAVLFFLKGHQFFDNGANPLDGGKLRFYDAGTTNARTVYKDADATVPWTQPVVLDSSGRLESSVYAPSGLLKYTLRNSGEGRTYATEDNVPVFPGGDIASQAQAVAGASNTVLMTPLRSQQLITANAGNGTVTNALAAPSYTRTVQSLFDESALSPQSFMAGVGLGVEETDTDAMQQLLAWLQAGSTGDVTGRGRAGMIPICELLIGESLSITEGKFSLRGSDKRGSVFKFGPSLGLNSMFKMAPTSAAVHVLMEDFRCRGNGLSGVSGNGHAIELMDPDLSAGAFVPQQVYLNRLHIDGFRRIAFENPSADVAQTIPACGIIQRGGLACVTQDVQVSSCGIGIYRRGTFQCVDERPLLFSNDAVGLLLYQNTDYHVLGGDIILNGDGGGNLTYPENIVRGNISAYREGGGCIIEKVKTKSSGGQAQFYAYACDSIHFKGCSIQPFAGVATVPNRAIVIESCTSWSIKECSVQFVATAVSPDDHEGFDIFNDQAIATKGTISDNEFEFPPGNDVAYCVRMRGGGRFATSIEDNQFGNLAGPTSGSIVADAILASSVTLDACRIAYNSFNAGTNATITSGLTLNGVTDAGGNLVGPNQFRASGGAITAEYTNVAESVQIGSGVWDPPSVGAQSSQTTTIAMTGVTSGDLVTAINFTQDTLGCIPTGKATVGGVIVTLTNPTAGALNPGSGTVTIRVVKAAYGG